MFVYFCMYVTYLCQAWPCLCDCMCSGVVSIVSCVPKADWSKHIKENSKKNCGVLHSLRVKTSRPKCMCVLPAVFYMHPVAPQTTNTYTHTHALSSSPSRISSLWPRNVWMHCPDLTSQILHVLSIDPEMHFMPSQSNWHEDISPRCPACIWTCAATLMHVCRPFVSWRHASKNVIIDTKSINPWENCVLVCIDMCAQIHVNFCTCSQLCMHLHIHRKNRAGAPVCITAEYKKVEWNTSWTCMCTHGLSLSSSQRRDTHNLVEWRKFWGKKLHQVVCKDAVRLVPCMRGACWWIHTFDVYVRSRHVKTRKCLFPRLYVRHDIHVCIPCGEFAQM